MRDSLAQIGMGAPMEDVSFVARAGLPSHEVTWRLSGDQLYCGAGEHWRHLPLREIVFMRLFGSPGLAAPYLGGATVAQGFDVCELKTATGETLSFNSNHFVSLGNFEDRTATFRPFVAALAPAVASANPAARFVWGMPPLVWGSWALLMGLTALVALFGLAIGVAGLTHGAVADGLVGLLFVFSAGWGAMSMWRTVSGGRTRPFDPRGAPQ